MARPQALGTDRWHHVTASLDHFRLAVADSNPLIAFGFSSACALLAALLLRV